MFDFSLAHAKVASGEKVEAVAAQEVIKEVSWPRDFQDCVTERTVGMCLVVVFVFKLQRVSLSVDVAR